MSAAPWFLAHRAIHRNISDRECLGEKTLTIVYRSTHLRYVQVIRTLEPIMSHASADRFATETDRHLHEQLCAYNIAFAELGLRFRWDREMLRSLASIEGDAQRLAAYIETHHPHLLSAYSCEFLCAAILERKNAQAPGSLKIDRIAVRSERRAPPDAAPGRFYDWDEPGLPALAGA